jgi:hypothetical protein
MMMVVMAREKILFVTQPEQLLLLWSEWPVIIVMSVVMLSHYYLNQFKTINKKYIGIFVYSFAMLLF